MSEFKQLVFSGVQPTGNLHLGNYLGALQKFVALQDTYECIYCVVDLHSLTATLVHDDLPGQTRSIAAAYLAAGLDPKKSIIFNQSRVPQHAELAWIFNCVARIGWMNRMTQFKDKAAKQQAESVSAGLLGYPVLMAADILLYQADAVPVGDDQRQHLEFTRDLAQRFNHLFGETFTIPEAMIPLSGARIHAFDDPTAKMSKSNPNEYHAVHLLDPPDRIRKTVMRAVTDSGREIRFSKDPARAGVNNLLELYEALTGQTREAIEAHFESARGYGDLKKEVAEVLIETLTPIQERYRELTADVSYIDELLAQGAARAAAVANETLELVRERMGFLKARA